MLCQGCLSIIQLLYKIFLQISYRTSGTSDLHRYIFKEYQSHCLRQQRVKET